MGGLVILVLILGLVIVILMFKDPLKNIVGPATGDADKPAVTTEPAGNDTPAASGQDSAPADKGPADKSPAAAPGDKPTDTTTVKPEVTSPADKPTAPADKPTDKAVDKPAPATVVSPATGKNVLVIEGTPPTTPKKPSSTTTAVPREQPAAIAGGEARDVRLYWVRVSDDSVIHLEKTSRKINVGDSPLTATMRTMLKGPSSDDLNRGLQSVIPPGTQLLSAYIQNGTAFLNFSEEFQYNPTGAEGARAQLRQIVWTATEFDTVKAVQILIEGKRQAFLGGDGIAIGKPLTRSDLN